MSHDLQIEAQMVLQRDKQTRKNRIGTSLNPMNGAEVGFALWFWPGVVVESTAGPEPTGSSCNFLSQSSHCSQWILPASKNFIGICC